MSCNKSSGCPKSGIKIHESSNDYRHNPFSQQNQTGQTTQTGPSTRTTATAIQRERERERERPANATNATTIDLNIDNYSIDDIFNLFKIAERILTEDIMKQSKSSCKCTQTNPEWTRNISYFIQMLTSAFIAYMNFKTNPPKRPCQTPTIPIPSIAPF